MADSWTMSVGGRVYGPYSLEQMQGFHAEKRLASHSLIARQGQEQFYPAGEDPIPGITGETLYQAIKRKGHLEVQFIPDKNDIVAHLVGELKRGDMALTLGAGDIYKIGEELLEALK